ncbi:hypothetical protein P171DRAFT_477993 [Karstenula rhodostoma CBS 690.94]|uniref:Uncharacterized protein n=1 Tax=Karstenula rhodostoma CBS 690.94 TaxID=1392251 RepID=A0A9P4P744_9PLEO|nr:hypothetical protein P171DRAFT_477993 [Karstenula rhodostoma CBS 690.94]
MTPPRISQDLASLNQSDCVVDYDEDRRARGRAPTRDPMPTFLEIGYTCIEPSHPYLREIAHPHEIARQRELSRERHENARAQEDTDFLFTGAIAIVTFAGLAFAAYQFFGIQSWQERVLAKRRFPMSSIGAAPEWNGWAGMMESRPSSTTLFLISFLFPYLVSFQLFCNAGHRWNGIGGPA